MIDAQPLGGDIPMGDYATLECQASGRGLVIYSWERRESNGNWTVVDNNNTTAYIASVSGLYRCRVNNEAGSVVSNSVTVNVYGQYCCVICMQVNVYYVCRSPSDY